MNVNLSDDDLPFLLDDVCNVTRKFRPDRSGAEFAEIARAFHERKFLKCMWNKPPGAVITYQDHAICSAIQEVFLNTPHHFCIWHVKQHIKTHLKEFYADANKNFRQDFNRWFYASTVEVSD